MLTYLIIIPILSIILLGVNLIFAPHNPKISVWDKLSNSGDILKILILSCSWKTISGWINNSGIVTSQNMSENEIGDRGSKSVNTVKEQRVDGSWNENNSFLRCTLFGLKINLLAKILSNHINLS